MKIKLNSFHTAACVATRILYDWNYFQQLYEPNTILISFKLWNY